MCSLQPVSYFFISFQLLRTILPHLYLFHSSMPPLPPLALTLLQNKEKELLLRKPWAFKRNFRNCLYLLLIFLTVNFSFFLLSTEESACHHSEARLLHSPIFLTIFIDVVLFHFQSVSYWSAEKKKYFISSPQNPLELL